MSREIKFRAWHQTAGEMLYDQNFGDCLRWYREGQSLEIMQYTGLKDRNGKEIYEADIHFDPMRENTAVVCYDSVQARYKSVPISLYKANAGNGGWTGYELKGYTEVIGNIYENPELLEARSATDPTE